MDVNWRNHAACRSNDPELFFPIGPYDTDRIRRATAVCRRCPVIDPCLAWALRTGQDSGVWGGRTAEERRRMRGAVTGARARGG